MHGSLREKFSAKMEFHTAAMQNLIDKRLEEKLPSFQQQLQALIFSQAASTASGSASVGSGHHTDMDSLSPGSSTSMYSSKRKHKRKRTESPLTVETKSA